MAFSREFWDNQLEKINMGLSAEHLSKVCQSDNQPLDPFVKDWKADEPVKIECSCEVGCSCAPTSVSSVIPVMTFGAGVKKVQEEFAARYGDEKGIVPAPQQRQVDPKWDEYFEMAFREACTLLRENVELRGVAGEIVSGPEWAAMLADKMLEERERRMK